MNVMSLYLETLTPCSNPPISLLSGQSVSVDHMSVRQRGRRGVRSQSTSIQRASILYRCSVPP